MLAKLFPGRDRRQIKAKWVREDRLNPDKITAAFKSRKKIDVEDWTQRTGRKVNFDEPIPDDPMDKINEMRRLAEAEGQVVERHEGRRKRGRTANGEDEGQPAGRQQLLLEAGEGAADNEEAPAGADERDGRAQEAVQQEEEDDEDDEAAERERDRLRELDRDLASDDE